MVFRALVLQLYVKNGKKKKEDGSFLIKKTGGKRDICGCKLQGESFE